MNLQKALGVSFSRNILYLYLNRLLVQIAFGLITGFGTLFFYEKFGNSIPWVLVYLSFLYLSFAIFNHISAKFLKKLGMKKMMIFALCALSIMFLSRTIWDISPVVSLIGYFVTFTLYKSFYWVPFHVEFATFTDRKSRGKQMATLYNVAELSAAVLPFIGGFILSLYGYNALFVLGFIFVIISIYPLFKIEETHEEYDWKLKKLVGEIFDKQNRSMVLSNFGNGAQVTVAGIIWPIFVFIATDEDYIKFGSILAIVSLILIVLRWVVGKYLDKVGRNKVLRIGNFLYFTGWIFKVFIQGITGIFITDIYHRFGNMVNDLSFRATNYDQAADNGHYVDEYTVLKETSFLLGRAAMAFALIPVVIFWNIKTTFLFGAVATLLMIFIKNRTVVE